MRPLLCLLPLLLLGACARHHVITGTVLDRNGKPVQRAVVSLKPGNVELITDENGAFSIDYLRDDAGERTKLDKRANYELAVFKPGFHEATAAFYYKRGELLLEPVSMVEDTIRVEANTDNIDPSLYPDRAQNHGAAYEGE